MVGQLQLLLDDGGKVVEVRLRAHVLVDRRRRPIDEFALGGHQPGLEARTADVDRQDRRGQLPRRLELFGRLVEILARDLLIGGHTRLASSTRLIW